MSRALSLALVCILLSGAGLVQGSAGGLQPDGVHRDAPAGAAPDARALPRPAAQSQFDSTTFTVTVFANGTARWTISYATPSLNESEQAAFRAYADDFETNETTLWSNFLDRAALLTRTGERETGRNMTARNFSRSAGLNVYTGGRGTVRMSFLWTNFAREAGDRVIVGDVFDGAFYIDDNQWLVFQAGPELDFVADQIDPEPDEFSGPTIGESETLTWIDSQRFADKRPRVVLTTDGASGGSTASPTDSPSAGADGLGPLAVAALLFLVVLIAVGAWQTDRFGGDDPAGGETVERDDGGSASGPTASAGSHADAGSEPATAAEPSIADEELLTDENRVLKLLESNGGRMKQANIVDETGWSKSKVSMLLSDMEDEEQISKLRVGRENIVSLSGHEPDAAGSPFDDDSA